MAMVIFSLGSNIGNRESYLAQTRNAMQQFLTDFKASRVMETAPQYVTDQPSFLNQVVMGNTDISAFEIVLFTQGLQEQIGRTKTFQNGPREIDIDILYYDDLIMNSENLVIPHPRITERFFVLEPLCEIAPDWQCPVTGKSIHVMLSELKLKSQG